MDAMELLFLNAQEVSQALPMQQAIPAMKQAFQQYSSGQADLPLRTRIDVSTHDGSTLFMPALLAESESFAIKVVSVFPGNASLDLPTIHAIVVAIDPQTGAPIAVLEAASLTAIRTGAASGAATDVLAREDSSTLALFGSGSQARTQVEAVCHVREIATVKVFSLENAQAEQLCREMSERLDIAIELAKDPEDAIGQADIICTATTAMEPVFKSADVRPGTHINAIGSFTPTMQEVDVASLNNPLIIVDSQEAVLAESGDLIIPIQSGLLNEQAIHAELGYIFNGTKEGRQSPDQITYFKSVGIAVQDAIAASTAIARARESGLGKMLAL
jgi:alanine dehydrogenase